MACQHSETQCAASTVKLKRVIPHVIVPESSRWLTFHVSGARDSQYGHRQARTKTSAAPVFVMLLPQLLDAEE